MTVVVEAAEPSGSLITSDFARDLGRSVAAVPGHVTSRVARGTNGLLRDGAIPITRPEDVLDELFGAGTRRVPAAVDSSPSEPGDPLLRRALSAAERHQSVGAIAAETGTTVAQARAALGRLEADGYLVRRDLGGWERALGRPGPAGAAGRPAIEGRVEC
jgi:DNA processing protein